MSIRDERESLAEWLNFDPFNEEAFEAIDAEMRSLKLRPGVRTWGDVRRAREKRVPLQQDLFNWA